MRAAAGRGCRHRQRRSSADERGVRRLEQIHLARKRLAQVLQHERVADEVDIARAAGAKLVKFIPNPSAQPHQVAERAAETVRARGDVLHVHELYHAQRRACRENAAHAAEKGVVILKLNVDRHRADHVQPRRGRRLLQGHEDALREERDVLDRTQSRIFRAGRLRPRGVDGPVGRDRVCQQRRQRRGKPRVVRGIAAQVKLPGDARAHVRRGVGGQVGGDLRGQRVIAAQRRVLDAVDPPADVRRVIAERVGKVAALDAAQPRQLLKGAPERHILASSPCAFLDSVTEKSRIFPVQYTRFTPRWQARMQKIMRLRGFLAAATQRHLVKLGQFLCTESNLPPADALCRAENV